ncbi:hypothetical protein GCM10023189_52580 [Nibrella saemangeumensis]|uniref:Integrase catalytic domain-containing protein n=1 Tax=Nibrella saemangeumensis TaxID=1084526 RepID=A0ABP8NJI1_9BACT
MNVSRTAYYRFLRGASYQPSSTQQEYIQAVEQVFKTHKRRYGSRRIVAELQEAGQPIGRHRVRTILKAKGLVAIQPKSFVPRTTDSRHNKGYWPNRLLNEPLPVAPNQIWVSDITYLPLVDGQWAYLASWMDLFSRRIVGWRVDDNMEDTLVVKPLATALELRQPPKGLIIHSDRGGQYVSTEIKTLLDRWQLQPSMSRADDPYDNAYAESFWSRFKAEVLEDGAFMNLDDARTEIFDYIEVYHNRVRRHSSLGNKSPVVFEQDFYTR